MGCESSQPSSNAYALFKNFSVSCWGNPCSTDAKVWFEMGNKCTWAAFAGELDVLRADPKYAAAVEEVGERFWQRGLSIQNSISHGTQFNESLLFLGDSAPALHFLPREVFFLTRTGLDGHGLLRFRERTRVTRASLMQPRHHTFLVPESEEGNRHHRSALTRRCD